MNFVRQPGERRVERAQRGFPAPAAHPAQLREVAVRLRIIGPKRERLLEHALGLVEAIQVLQRPRQHQARLRGGDAERECAARGRLRFHGMAEIALRGGEVVPAHAIPRIRRQRAAQARRVGRAVGSHRRRFAYCEEAVNFTFQRLIAGLPTATMPG